MDAMIHLKPLALADKRKSSIAVHVYLRELILQGVLPPGTTLSQLELSKALGVSRTPLREAFRMLQEEGLIDAEPNLRARVSAFDASDLAAVYANRMMLEGLGISLTIPHLTQDDLHTLESCLHQMEVANTVHDFNSWHQAHQEFHRLLTSHSSETLMRTLRTLQVHSERFFSIYQPTNNTSWWEDETVHAEHRALLDACKQQRHRDAARLISSHLARFALTVLTEMDCQHEAQPIYIALELLAGLVPSQYPLPQPIQNLLSQQSIY